jgi:Uma2 family endonuclease
VAETKALVTADELLSMPDDGWRYELRCGELIQMVPPGARHGQFQNGLLAPLTTCVRRDRLGLVVAEVGFRLSHDPDTVRAPDVAFVRRARIPAEGVPVGYWEGAPDLAVEVVSPSDSAEDVREKIGEYLAAGASLVWIVYPRGQTVDVWRADGSRVALSSDGTLEGEDVVPGFSLPVAEIFADW